MNEQVSQAVPESPIDSAGAAPVPPAPIDTLSEKIVRVCRRLHDKNFLAAADGNVSARDEDGTILITPTGRHKGFLEVKDLARISIDNQIISGAPSGERSMHLEIYKQVPKAKWVVHAHPPTAIAWSVAYPELNELPSKSLSEVILAVGRIPIVPYARPVSQDMGSALLPFLPGHRAMILARHGAVAWGEDDEEAYGGIERVEAVAVILKLSKQLGGLTELPDNELQYLYDLRSKFGDRTL